MQRIVRTAAFQRACRQRQRVVLKARVLLCYLCWQRVRSAGSHFIGRYHQAMLALQHTGAGTCAAALLWADQVGLFCPKPPAGLGHSLLEHTHLEHPPALTGAAAAAVRSSIQSLPGQLQLVWVTHWTCWWRHVRSGPHTHTRKRAHVHDIAVMRRHWAEEVADPAWVTDILGVLAETRQIRQRCQA